jgi:acyl CoA:acetate/3-ketoacid CoA transferase alpha subunit
MAKEKTTITVERHKVDEARRLTGARSTSAAIDVALDRLIRAERLRRDIAVYTGKPPTSEEMALAANAPPWDDLADDTDWDALYAHEG